MHVLVVYTSMFSYMFLAFPAIYHLPIVKKEDRDVGDNGPDLGYKGEVNMEPIMLYCKS